MFKIPFQLFLTFFNLFHMIVLVSLTVSPSILKIWMRAVSLIIFTHPTELNLRQEDPLKLYSYHPEEIGEGGFCKVYKAVNLSTQEEVALKIASKADLQQICTDLLMQITLEHPNIVATHTCYCWQDQLYVLFRT